MGNKVFIENPVECMQSHKDARCPFHLKKSMYRIDITSDYGEFEHYENSIPQSEIFLLRMVKSAAKKIPLEAIPFVNRNEIKYFNISKFFGEYQNCWEVDLTGAYWEIAFNSHLEWMSLNVYERGKTVGKLTRLTALGNLAKNVTEMYFDGNKFDESKTKNFTEPTRDLFFYAAKEVGEIMDTLRIVCRKPLFFWVDALFTADERDLEIIYSVLEEKKLFWKTLFCEKIIGNENEIIVYSQEHLEKELKKWKAGKLENKPKDFRVFNKEVKGSDFYINQFKYQIYTERKIIL